MKSTFEPGRWESSSTSSYYSSSSDDDKPNWQALENQRRQEKHDVWKEKHNAWKERKQKQQEAREKAERAAANRYDGRPNPFTTTRG